MLNALAAAAVIADISAYERPSADFYARVCRENALDDVTRVPYVRLMHSYKSLGLRGALETVYARNAVVNALSHIAERLGSDYELVVFDAFRPLETQLHLFETIYAQIQAKHPGFSHDELWSQARQFASYPEASEDPWRVPPHNSGGAVDISLAHRGVLLDMGTDFDAVCEASATAFFEQPPKGGLDITQERWLQVRRNRRLLFGLMRSEGFINYAREWWHYDLGDRSWAAAFKVEPPFGSLELAVQEAQRSSAKITGKCGG